MSTQESPAKKARPSSSQSSQGQRITVGNVNVPGYTTTVDVTMHNATRQALLKVLPMEAPGLTQAEMFEAVVPHPPSGLFPGGAKAGWGVKTVRLDLEAKGQFVREPVKPLRWHRKSSESSA